MWNSIKTWWKKPFQWTRGKLVIAAVLATGLWWVTNHQDVVVNVTADMLYNAAELIEPDTGQDTILVK